MCRLLLTRLPRDDRRGRFCVKSVAEEVTADRRRRRCRLRYLLVLVAAMALGLGAAMPVFAADEGGPYQAQIVGGTAVPNGKYPFVSALLDVRRGNTGYEQQFCGASLIDRNSVLTAAHCLITPKRYLRVVVGRTVLSSNQGQVRAVSEITAHPRYNELASTYDAAVIDLTAACLSSGPT